MNKKEKNSKTPLLDELEKGPWPSFVTEMKKMASEKDYVQAHIEQVEKSYRDKIGYWKHGGALTVWGYGGGTIARYSDLPELKPAPEPEIPLKSRSSDVHTLRVAQPGGWFYTTEKLRKLCDVWEKYGSGLVNLHGSTGDIILLGTTTKNLQPCFDELSKIGFDLGGSGSVLRSLSSCVGPALCEWSCIDTLDLYHDLTMEFQEEIHRPRFPYKYKIKISGCPNDCVAALARADMPIIGTWRDEIKIDQEAVRDYARDGLDIDAVCARCPTRCMSWDGKELTIRDEDCTRCMYCINKMSKALRPGDEKGATIMMGGKATILKSPYLSWVIVPFMKMEKPYTELKDLIRRILDWYYENGRSRERPGEIIYRMGMDRFLKDVGLPAVPQQVMRPRANPYWRR